MSVNLTINGVTYTYPTAGQAPGWGAQATAWAQAVTQGMLQKSGGAFTLTSEVDFGANFGLKSIYYKSRENNPATAGSIRLANDDAINWRNAANSANLALKVNASNVLEFGGNPLLTLALGTADYVLKMNSAGTAYEFSQVVDASVASGADINAAKLADGSVDNTAFQKLGTAGTDADGELVTTDGAQRLKNKLANSDSFGVVNPSDATKAYRFFHNGSSGAEAQFNCLASVTRIYTLLDADYQIVGHNTTQTLTNKTINAPDNSITNISNSSIAASAAIAYSKLALSGSILNADINASAAIAYSKLALNNAITFSDLSSSTCTIDEDNMATNSASRLPTQQSVKAYVDTQIASISATGTLYSAKSADYTILDNDNIRTIGMTTSTTNRTVTLPAAANNTDRIISIKKVDSASGVCIVDGNSSETIDGSTTLVLINQNDAVDLQCDGSNWFVISDSRTMPVYAHGGSYNGGGAPTVTLSSGGGTLSSIGYSVFIPYLAGSTWRLRFNVRANVSNTTRTSGVLAVNGIDITDVQAVSAISSVTSTISYIRADGGSNLLSFYHDSGSTAAYIFSGDVQLNSKPTWAW